MWQQNLITFVLIALLLMTSGLFSAAEISFLALGRVGARRLSEGRAGLLIQKLLSRPARTLGVLLVTITAINYTAETIATIWVIGHGLPVWVAIVGMAALVMIFAEVVPITYAAANAERVARTTVGALWVASWAMSAPARLVGYAADRLARLFGGHPQPELPVTEGEIRAIVDLQAESGALEQEEKDMIHHIFEFGDKVAREVMVPRLDIAAIPEQATLIATAQVATERRVSRLLVYRRDLDDIVGVVHVKDILPLLASGHKEAPVSSVTQPAYRVPETKRLSDLLSEFQRRRRSLAVVVDEYGGTAGLVTLEDLLEEVVGDIYDEYDVVQQEAEEVVGGAIALDAALNLAEASEILGVPLPEGDYDSVGGLLYSRFGTVPQVGQRLALGAVTLVVEKVEGNRIARVRALKRHVPPTDTATGREV